MTANEKERIEKQREELGDDRLTDLGSRLDKAVDDNDVHIYSNESVNG